MKLETHPTNADLPVLTLERSRSSTGHSQNSKTFWLMWMKNKPEFWENFDNHAQADPLDGHGSEEFNWQQIYKAFGESESEDTQASLIKNMAEVFRALLMWLVQGEIDNHYEKKVGRRAIAMAWVLDPSMFDGSPSLTKLAQRLGYTKYSLSIVTSDFSKTFNFFSRAQANGKGRRRGKESFNPPTQVAGSAAAPGSYGSTRKTLTPPQEAPIWGGIAVCKADFASEEHSITKNIKPLQTRL